MRISAAIIYGSVAKKTATATSDIDIPTVPDWPEFLSGCVRYRQSLDEQAADAPRTKKKQVDYVL